MLKVFISGKGWYLCVNMCVCVSWTCECARMCVHIFLFSKFSALAILFLKLKKKKTPQTKDLTSSSHWVCMKPFPSVTCLPPLKCLGRLLGNCSLVTIPTCLVPAPPKPFFPTPNYPAKSPSGPTATWPERCRAGPAGRQAERPNTGWAEMVPRASVSFSAHCRDTALCYLPPPLGCSADSVTVGLKGPFYTA